MIMLRQRGSQTTNGQPSQVQEIYSRWDSAFTLKQRLAVDLPGQPRPEPVMVSRFEMTLRHSAILRENAYDLYARLMRGTPIVITGMNCAMTNIGFDRIGDYQDVPTLNEYQHQKNIGGDLKAFLEKSTQLPRQWPHALSMDDSPQAGFTTGTPWLKVNPNYSSLNAASQNPTLSVSTTSAACMHCAQVHAKAGILDRYSLVDKDNPRLRRLYPRTQWQTLVDCPQLSPQAAPFQREPTLAAARLLVQANYPGGGAGNDAVAL